VGQAGPLMLAVAGAVADLHRQAAVHGAISLDTLVREPAATGGDPSSGRVRLLQFPLAGDPHLVPQRVVSEQPEEIERLGRRASFVAPELMLPGRACDARSDVYALGCVFHSLLTGTPPCWRGNAQRTLTEAAFVGPPPLGQSPSGQPAVPVEVATLISYMVPRDPAARYPTAVEAAQAIAACFGLQAAGGPLPVVPSVPAAASIPPALPAAFPVALPAGGPAAVPAIGRDAAIQAATLAARRRAARLRTIGLGVMGGLVAMVAALIVSSLGLGPGKTASPRSSVPAGREAGESPEPASAPAVAAAKNPAAGDGPPERVAGPALVDDPTLPWASPTTGEPPTLDYLPPDSRLILLARPAEIEGDEEGRLFLRSLGPRVEAAIQSLTSLCGRGLDRIELLQAGWHAGGPDEIVGGYMVRFDDATEPPAGATPEQVGGETIHKGKPLSFWLPAAEQGRVLVLAPEAMLREMVARAGDGTGQSLPSDMELLLGMLDRSRHLTLFGSPTYLLHDGRGVMAGPLEKLIEPLADFLGPSSKAAAVSFHFGETFYAEIDAIGTVDAPAANLAGTLAGKIQSLADVVEEYCVALDPHPYGRKLVLRLPAMIRLLAANARSGAEGKGVVVNSYLPRHAGHNLVLAAELALEQAPGRQQQPAAGGAAGGEGSRADGAAAGALGKLQKKISLVFARDTLEKSIQMVSEEVGVPMDILGGDLQLEGITKNQSFGLDERDKTADAILRTILAKSNPDGKLVYVVHVKDGMEVIDITTRAAAAKRGDKLPPGF